MSCVCINMHMSCVCVRLYTNIHMSCVCVCVYINMHMSCGCASVYKHAYVVCVYVCLCERETLCVNHSDFKHSAPINLRHCLPTDACKALPMQSPRSHLYLSLS